MGNEGVVVAWICNQLCKGRGTLKLKEIENQVVWAWFRAYHGLG